MIPRGEPGGRDGRVQTVTDRNGDRGRDGDEHEDENGHEDRDGGGNGSVQVDENG